MALKRVPIKELSAKLGYKDVRTAYNWCDKNGLLVYSDGRLRFVLKKELDIALDGAIIDKLKQLHPDSWKEKYKTLITERNDTPSEEIIIKQKTLTEPKIESEFLKKLKRIATDESNRIS